MPENYERAASPVLIFAWKAVMLQRKYIGAAANGHGLTQNEKDVLLFLFNNKQLDTAADIVKYRSISKSLVAKSVKNLTERGFLKQEPDKADARYVHLAILPAASSVISELKQAEISFHSSLLKHLDEPEADELKRLLLLVEQSMDEELEMIKKEKRKGS